MTDTIVDAIGAIRATLPPCRTCGGKPLLINTVPPAWACSTSRCAIGPSGATPRDAGAGWRREMER